MSGPFRRTPEGIRVELEQWEADVLRSVPGLLSSVGDPEVDPAAARLLPSPYPEDPEEAAEYRRLMDEEITQSRRADRSAFELTVEHETVTLSEGEAGAWLRVIGEARLVVAARAGIRDDGWESETEPAAALLHYLGALQHALVEALEEVP